MEKGILTEKLEAKIAQGLDELIKLKGVWENFDGLAFKGAISTIDNTLGAKIPEPYQTDIREMLTDILEEKDYQTASAKAAELVDSLVDIPGLDDATEAMVFRGAFQIVAAVLAKVGTNEAAG